MSELADFLRDGGNTGPRIRFTVATGGINAGEVVKITDVYALAYRTYAAAAVGVGVVESDNCMIPKSVGTGLTISAGDKLYLNTSTLVVSKTQGTGDLEKGYALEAATATATHVQGVWRGDK